MLTGKRAVGDMPSGLDEVGEDGASERHSLDSSLFKDSPREAEAREPDEESLDLDDIKIETGTAKEETKSHFKKPSMKSLDLAKVKTPSSSKKLPAPVSESAESNTDSERSLQGADDVVDFIS